MSKRHFNVMERKFIDPVGILILSLFWSLLLVVVIEWAEKSDGKDFQEVFLFITTTNNHDTLTETMREWEINITIEIDRAQDTQEGWNHRQLVFRRRNKTKIDDVIELTLSLSFFYLPPRSQLSTCVVFYLMTNVSMHISLSFW